MRHKGSISHTNLERDRVVPLLYRKAKGLVAWPADTMDICRKAASLPVSKFYISQDAAVSYIRHRYYHDDCKKFCSRYKQQLYDALYEKFLELTMRPEYENRVLPEVVAIALDHPAPCSGLAPAQFYRIMRRHRKEQKI